MTGGSVSGYHSLDTTREDGCRKDGDCPLNHYCQPSSSGFRNFRDRFKSKTFEYIVDGKCILKGILYIDHDFENLEVSYEIFIILLMVQITIYTFFELKNVKTKGEVRVAKELRIRVCALIVVMLKRLLRRA